MNNKTRAEVEWSSIKEDIKKKLEANWVLPLRNSQLARITAERSKRIELEKRRVNAKAVHIFQNKNRNPKSQAVIEFENKEDSERALERKLKYFNYMIEWEHRLEELAQRLVEKIKEKLIGAFEQHKDRGGAIPTLLSW
ncbi:26841_t:CDS:2, partial [Gigaspora margarita]